MNKFNILYIHSHDTGRYIQPYGHAVSTPVLQQLAGEGVLFRQAFTASPTCSPSRACLLTGQSAHSNAMTGLAHRGFSVNDYGKHLLHTLREHGYFSALAGIQHIAHGKDAWKTIGYDRYLGADSPEENAAGFLSDPPEKPFFLSVGFFETHRKYPQYHPADDARYCLPPSPLPDTPETREDMSRFKQHARELDRKMGFVFNALRKSGLEKNTLVICTTDHGIAFPGMKCNLKDTGTGVMLIMKGPGGFSGGKVIDELTSQIDIYPSICDLLGIEKPEWLEGESFMPVISGESETGRKAVYSEINYHASYEPQRAVRTKRWKYIRRWDYRTGPVLPNCDASLSKDLWLSAGWQDKRPDQEALYDLLLDPNEMNNLVHNEKYKLELGDMKGLLHRWMISTSDPLIDGDVPVPESARHNPRDGLDPGDDSLLPAGKR